MSHSWRGWRTRWSLVRLHPPPILQGGRLAENTPENAFEQNRVWRSSQTVLVKNGVGVQENLILLLWLRPSPGFKNAQKTNSQH